MIRAAFVGAVVLVAGYTAWRSLRRSPCDVARAASGIDIPCTGRVVAFHDRMSGLLGQDLDARVEIIFPAQDFAQVVSTAQATGFQTAEVSEVPCREELNQFGISATGRCEAASELAGREGLFHYSRETPSSYALVVLDVSRHRLVARLIIL